MVDESKNNEDKSSRLSLNRSAHSTVKVQD